MKFHHQRLHLAPNNQPKVVDESLQTAVATLSLGGALGRITSKFVAREGPVPDGKSKLVAPEGPLPDGK